MNPRFSRRQPHSFTANNVFTLTTIATHRRRMPYLISFGTQRKTGRDVVDEIRKGFDGIGTLLFLEPGERCRHWRRDGKDTMGGTHVLIRGYRAFTILSTTVSSSRNILESHIHSRRTDTTSRRITEQLQIVSRFRS